MNALAEYQNEKMFFAQIVGDIIDWHIKKPLIRFFFVKPRNCVFKIVEVAMAHLLCDKFIRMKLDQQEKDVSIYTAQVDEIRVGLFSACIPFRVKIANTNENNCFADATWTTDLWSEKQFADVDVLVGQNKLQAHRVVLSARSPVLNTLLSKISHTGKCKLRIGADEVDSAVVEHFLKYLYTGTLSISANNKQLLALAEMYQVETLKAICQLAVRVPDADEITTSFLAFI